ncbi:MAG: hypothetical protein EOP39_28950 [Rubrivivax sp.]|nr:MAG: hypothetical protein EOP39_28950 [Rubrivivax sp.]
MKAINVCTSSVLAAALSLASPHATAGIVQYGNGIVQYGNGIVQWGNSIVQWGNRIVQWG